MRTLVPFATDEPKTRLAPVLDAEERHAFAEAMLRDVLDALAACGRDPEVLATGSVECPAPVTVDERPLDPAINDRLGGPPLAVVMADLALATPAAIDRLYAPDADVVLAPGMGGGTNAFLARHPDFHVDYHGASIRDHRHIARSVGADLREVDSRRLATDVDEPADLAEVLLHAEGAAADWLRDAGFEVVADGGRVTVERD